MEPQRLVDCAVYANDHGRGHIRRFQKPSPRRDHLPVTGEHDRLGRNWRDIHRDLPAIIVVECFSDQLAGDSVGLGRFWPGLGEFIHTFILTAPASPASPRGSIFSVQTLYAGTVTTDRWLRFPRIEKGNAEPGKML